MGGEGTLTPKAPSQGLASYVVHKYAGMQLPEAYKGLIYSKWLRSLRFGNDVFRRIDSNSYYKHYHGYICRLLGSPECVVSLAVLSDDDDVVLGFAVSRGSTLDYVHVHKDNRRIGIGSKLIPSGITTFSHTTRTWDAIWDHKYSDWKFNPFE